MDWIKRFLFLATLFCLAKEFSFGQSRIPYYEGEPKALHAINQQARVLVSVNPDSVYLLTNQILAQVDSATMPYTVAYARMSQGLAKNTDGKWKEAELIFKNVIPVFRRLGDSLAVADAMDYMSFPLNEQGFLDQHLELQLKVLDYRERYSAPLNQIARSYSIIGSVYLRLGDLEPAKEQYLKTLEIRKIIPNLSAHFFGFTLRSLGRVYQQQQNYQAAEEHYKMAIDSFRVSRVNQFTREGHQLLGQLYLEQDKLEEAEENFAEALEIAIGINSISQRGIAYHNLALLYEAQLNLPAAMDHLDSARYYLQKGSALTRLKDSYLMTANIYEKMDKPNQSLSFFKLYDALKDTLNTNESADKMAELRTQYQIEKQEQQIQSLEQQHQQGQLVRLLLLLGLALAGIAIIAIIRANAKRRKAFAELKLEKEKADQLNQDLKDAQTQLIQSEKMASLGQLTAGIAHEINNPINFINSNAEALKLDFEEVKSILNLLVELQKKDSNGEELNQLIEKAKQIEMPFLLDEMDTLMGGITRGSNRVSAIVKGLKIFTHQSEGESKQEDVTTLLESALTILNNEIKKKEISLKKQFQPLPKVVCQAGKIDQVFVNIIDNAIAAVKVNGVLEIATMKQDNAVLIQIKDNGMGMDKETLKRIFDPFFTTKEVGKGTGLGMAISYGIIKEHGGNLEVESAVNKGTTVNISLPIVSKEVV